MTATTRSNATIAHPNRLYIGGEWVSSSSDLVFDVVSPDTEQTYLTVAAAGEVDIDRAVGAAREAFDRGPWPRMTHAERAGYLRRISERIAARAGEFADSWTSQMGIVRAVSGLAMAGVPPLYDYYAGLATTFPFTQKHQPSSGEGLGLLVREPVGVVAAIVAWNAPILLITLKVAPALLAGCTVIVKASPEAPAEAYLLAEIMDEVGLPKGVFNIVTADRAVSELLVRRPGVDKVAFTGSTAAGKRIASLCGERIARVSLELGGKSAGIVLQDADVDKVVAAMASSVCFMNGQVCASLTRVIVGPERHDEVVDALAAAYSGLVIGDPFDPATQIGPLAMQRQRDRVEDYVAKGRAEGARVVTGGGRPSHLNRGFYFEPTLFCDVQNEMTIAREEIFGPVTCVIKASDDEHAVAIANDTVYGLNATVFTEDSERAYRVAKRLHSGTVGHNADRADVGIAFGGFKQSGLGREGGEEGLRAYLEPKLVVLDQSPLGLAV